MQNQKRPSEQDISPEAFTQLVALSGSANANVAVGAARLLPVFCTTEAQVCSTLLDACPRFVRPLYTSLLQLLKTIVLVV